MEKAPRNCAWPGCPVLVTSRVRGDRCPAHRKDGRREGYSGDWRVISARWLANHPRCVSCGLAASEVDHVKMLRAGGSRTAVGNLRSLCKTCHLRHTIKMTRSPWRKPR